MSSKRVGAKVGRRIWKHENFSRRRKTHVESKRVSANVGEEELEAQ
jgi:hypothetical protein